MSLDKILLENQKKIRDLTSSMSLWLGTPAAQRKEVRARINELQDRTLHKLQELEARGQQAKIDSMATVIALLKGEIKP